MLPAPFQLIGVNQNMTVPTLDSHFAWLFWDTPQPVDAVLTEITYAFWILTQIPSQAVTVAQFTYLTPS